MEDTGVRFGIETDLLRYRFYCNPRKSHHLRVSFSIVSMENAEVGFKALGEAIREKRQAMGIDA